MVNDITMSLRGYGLGGRGKSRGLGFIDYDLKRDTAHSRDRTMS